MADETKTDDDIIAEPVFMFTDEQKTEPIKFKTSGGVKDYILRELMGPDLAKWQAHDASRITVTRNRIDMAPGAFRDYCAVLINMCLFDETGIAIPKATIMSWPSTAITSLFDKCQTMNGLNAEGKEQAKKV